MKNLIPLAIITAAITGCNSTIPSRPVETIPISSHPAIEHGGDIHVTFRHDTTENIKTAGAYQVVLDPVTGEGLVEKFTVGAGDCANSRLDCSKSSSGRYQMEQTPRGQPNESWYSYEFYLPEDFKYGTEIPNIPLLVLFNFKQDPHQHCPLLQFSHRSATPGWAETDFMVIPKRDTGHVNDGSGLDCDSPIPDGAMRPAKISDSLGKWTRVEWYIKWTTDRDGIIDTYVNGKHTNRYMGPTCKKTCKGIYRKYGMRYANMKGPRNAWEHNFEVFFKNVGQATKRELLPGYIAEEAKPLPVMPNIIVWRGMGSNGRLRDVTPQKPVSEYYKKLGFTEGR